MLSFSRRYVHLASVRRRSGQREWAALGIAADGPPLAWMDDRTAEIADAPERRWQVVDREVREGGGVAGTRPTFVNPEAKAVVFDLPPGAGFGGSRHEFSAQQTAPETARTIGVVSRKLDQRDGHGPEYAVVVGLAVAPARQCERRTGLSPTNAAPARRSARS